MTHTAKITVFLQAIGGHFLGANAFEPNNITVNFRYSGGEINMPYLVTQHFTDDGNVSPNFTNGASSFMPIITIPQPSAPIQTSMVNFLSGDFTTISAQANIDLPNDIEMATLSVSVPTTTGKPFLINQTVILNPAQPDYKIILPVAGLYLSASALPNSISVFVKMMCGCPVTLGPPASLWAANDFTVYANVLDTSGETTPYLLTYDVTQQSNSLFSAALSATQLPIKSVSFSAFQKSTGNYGVLVVDCEV
jgi:hypothetical protein